MGWDSNSWPLHRQSPPITTRPARNDIKFGVLNKFALRQLFFDSFTIPNTNVFELERPKNDSMYVVHVGNYIINQIGQWVFYNNN